MHVLVLHNRYLIRGGEDEVLEDEVALLRQHKHEVTEYIQDNRQVAGLAPWQAGLRTVWSGGDYRALRRLIREKRPDIVHIHNSFPLISPSALYAAKAEGVPVVQTIHNYRFFCANALFFRDGRVCEECLAKRIAWPGVIHSCYRDDRAATFAVVMMLATHRLLRTFSRKVDVYVALTEFTRQKSVQGGLPADRVVVKPNFVHPDPGVGDGEGGYMLYVGRLSPEKGIATLLAAWDVLSARIPLRIVGDGPMAAEVMEATERGEGVEWLGRQPKQRVLDLMKGAWALIFPSIWYEGFPKVIVEAYAVGLPVIGSNMGSMTSLIRAGCTGLHFSPGDAIELAVRVNSVLRQPEMLVQMRRNARREYETKYTAQRNCEALMEVYRLARGRE